MTTLKEKIEIMEWFEEGGEVEVASYADENDWQKCNNPVWNWINMEYRKVSAPVYVPYTFETFPKMPRYCVRKGFVERISLFGYKEDGTWVGSGDPDDFYLYADFLEEFTWGDGKPCGVKQ